MSTLPIVHTVTFPVGTWIRPGDVDLLAVPAIQNLVAVTDENPERQIFGMILDGETDNLHIREGRGHNISVFHGIIFDPDAREIYGLPVVGDETYHFTVQIVAGKTNDEGVFTPTGNLGQGRIAVVTTGDTIASEFEQVIQHAHPHIHRDYLQSFNALYARVAALEAHHPASPSGSSDSDSSDDDSDSNGETT